MTKLPSNLVFFFLATLPYGKLAPGNSLLGSPDGSSTAPYRSACSPRHRHRDLDLDSKKGRGNAGVMPEPGDPFGSCPLPILTAMLRHCSGGPALASLSHSQKLHKIPSHSHLAQFVSAPAPSQQPHALLARVALPKRSPERFTLKGKGKAIQSEQNIWRIIMERYG